MSRYDELVRTKETNLKFIHETSKIWNNSKCNSIEVIGPVMEYINDCYKFKEVFKFEDWETYFYNKVSKEQLNKCYFKFKEELDKNNIKYTKQQIIDTILIHTILQTYEGYTREEIAKQFLNNNKNVIKVEKTPKDVDKKYCIDYIVTLSNNKKIGVQVKSLSYLTMVINYDISVYKRMVDIMNSYFGCDEVMIMYIDHDRVTKLSEYYFDYHLGWWLK